MRTRNSVRCKLFLSEGGWVKNAFICISGVLQHAVNAYKWAVQLPCVMVQFMGLLHDQAPVDCLITLKVETQGLTVFV